MRWVRQARWRGRGIRCPTGSEGQAQDMRALPRRCLLQSLVPESEMADTPVALRAGRPAGATGTAIAYWIHPFEPPAQHSRLFRNRPGSTAAAISRVGRCTDAEKP